jgi:hypothetical protein
VSELDDWENPAAPSLAPQSQALSQLCLWSLILGIVSMACCGFLTAIPAIVCGHMGLSAVGDGSGPLRGRAFAIAGLVMGYLSLVLSCLSSLLLGAMYAADPAGFEELFSAGY